MTLIDLPKACDTIKNDILLNMIHKHFLLLVFLFILLNLSNRKFTVNLENSFFEILRISCNVSRRSILGSLLFLIYVNDMSMAVKCNLFLYVDDTWLIFQSKNVTDIEKQLSEDFTFLIEVFTLVKIKPNPSFTLLNVR